MDIFEAKNIKPMLISNMADPFDDPDCLFELKLDGERCIAYIDKTGTELRNKRNVKMLPKFPELADIHTQCKTKCILDGELIISKEGKPDFAEVQRRSITSNQFKRQLLSKQSPASFIAYDILYYKDRSITDLPLFERKKILDKILKSENDKIAVSRYIQGQGIAFYNLTVEQDLEGIVAKRKDSKYYIGKNTKDWVKIKNLKDDDYVVCGYIHKDNGITSIVLGQYANDVLIYKGHVTMGVSSSDFDIILSMPKAPKPEGFPDEDANWIEPTLVCVVKYMMKTSNGGLRQPVFKGLRFDKLATECIEKST